jgi:hypothetical protein
VAGGGGVLGGGEGGEMFRGHIDLLVFSTPVECVEVKLTEVD